MTHLAFDCFSISLRGKSRYCCRCCSASGSTSLRATCSLLMFSRVCSLVSWTQMGRSRSKASCTSGSAILCNIQQDMKNYNSVNLTDCGVNGMNQLLIETFYLQAGTLHHVYRDQADLHEWSEVNQLSPTAKFSKL